MRAASWKSRTYAVICLVAGLVQSSPSCLGIEAAGEPGQTVRARTQRGGERGTIFAARWIGQDGPDWTGAGPSVGPDGLLDVHIGLTHLASGTKVKAIRIEVAGKMYWEFGLNPRLLLNAELITDPKDPTAGDLFFQPGHNLRGQRLKVIVAYENEKFDTATVVAGQCEPASRVPESPLPALNESALDAKWVGQDGGNTGFPGDVHVVVSGLPFSSPIVAGVLTDGVCDSWIYRGDGRASISDDPAAAALVVKLRPGNEVADVFFAPYRDESHETMALRLIAASGQSFLVRFPGKNCDLSLRAARPDTSHVTAKPGDDLQALVAKFGTVVLAPGTYRLTRTLVLDRPVTLTSEGGATLLFDQGAGEPAWTSAIKIHCGNTTLDGFAVRFAGPVRWNDKVSWGSAVIGLTDSLEAPRNDPKFNLTFTRLDLESPPVIPSDRWVEAPRLMRLIGSRTGVISGNILRGGPIEFFAGPWRITDNEFRGTVPGTISHGVFVAHNSRDLLIRDNRARNRGLSGKTWRFLVLSGQGNGCAIERNIIDGLGALDGDTIPSSNEPEIILTESYLVKYEGSILGLSEDGRLLRTGRPQAMTARTGDVVSLLDGPAAGQWRRIVQAMDSTCYLVNPPIPAGTKVISITPGFVDVSFEGNRIDIRGGHKSTSLVLVGNHFGTKIVRNHILGGENLFKLTACPTEAPMIWGWTHAPYLGGLLEGNIFEDCSGEGMIGVEHSQHIKTNQGRTYMTMVMEDNVVRWTPSFFAFMAAHRKIPTGLTVGSSPSHDAGELVVNAKRNRLDAPVTKANLTTLVITAAQYNSHRVVNGHYRLPQDNPGVPASARGPSTRVQTKGP